MQQYVSCMCKIKSMCFGFDNLIFLSDFAALNAGIKGANHTYP